MRGSPTQYTPPLRLTDRTTQPAPAAPSWERSFGPGWRAQLALLALVVGALGALRPLTDPDLPLHLATGEWIARHRAVPFVEPFAWTRAGAPYYAYSWLHELLSYLAWRAGGQLGLALLKGAEIAAAPAAMWALGRAARWRPSVTLAMGALNFIVAVYLTSALRPQLLLLTLVPLCWALVYRVLHGDRTRLSLALLALCSAAAANTHLFFPITIAAAALFWVEGRTTEPLAWATAAAIVGGWLLSPYALAWPEVFALNFAPNRLLYFPSPIFEYRPGFLPVADPRTLLLPPVLALLLLPWALAAEGTTRRQRLLAAALWVAGLVAFGGAVRALLLWWLLVAVPVGWALQRFMRERRDERPRRSLIVAFYAMCVVVLVAQVDAAVASWRARGGRASPRTLPTPTARAAESLAAWLDREAPRAAGGRLFTTFAYGGYLTWRLPGYSASIDGRTIFPDSVAGAEAYVLAFERNPVLGPWRGAELAIVPARWRVAAVLDTAAGWHRAALAVDAATRGDTTVLWVTDAWWARSVGGAPPVAPATVRY